ncbi:MAG: hypothetical protein HC805_03265 [Alkalinema sp. RL_2_19]|nr:hypothetical protein [Alkalinema sp. RL_2_19]
MRESVASVRADPLQGQSLNQVLTELTQNFQRTTGTPMQCKLDVPTRLSPAISTAIYRVVQEGLTNIQKYADATAVNLCIECTPDGLSLTLQDNGKGFAIDANLSGFGLQGMKERIVALGGDLQINSQPQHGCQIRALFLK